MKAEYLKSKIHRATVTDANLNYTGSVTIDRKLMNAAGIKPHEKVQVVNISNGQRLETYVIEGQADSGVICLNGAAARKVEKGDRVIILSYCSLAREAAEEHEPDCVWVDEENQITRQEKL